ncbi:hypothetical protein PROPEN_02097 [Proteus penneri ATCC 35198]|nr:hypothetical protein PROPEN_02097 [Proteus penneri ATCC 35198]
MRILMLCGMIMLSAVAQARPNQEVPKIEEQAQSYYQITQKEVAYEGKQYRLFLAIPKKIPLRQRSFIVLMEMRSFH